MRFGLLMLSLAMLTGGGLAAQSALAISHSASTTHAPKSVAAQPSSDGAYGALPFTAARTETTRIAAR